MIYEWRKRAGGTHRSHSESRPRRRTRISETQNDPSGSLHHDDRTAQAAAAGAGGDAACWRAGPTADGGSCVNHS